MCLDTISKKFSSTPVFNQNFLKVTDLMCLDTISQKVLFSNTDPWHSFQKSFLHPYVSQYDFQKTFLHPSVQHPYVSQHDFQKFFRSQHSFQKIFVEVSSTPVFNQNF